jgi:hypothetical protein
MVSFLTIVFVLVLVGFYAYWRLLDIEHQATLIEEDAVPGLFYINQVETVITYYQDLLDEYFASPDDAELPHILTGTGDKKREIDHALGLYETSITTQEDRTLFDAVKKANDGYLHASGEALRSRTENRTADARAKLRRELKPNYEAVKEAIRKVGNSNKERADKATGAISRNLRAFQSNTMLGLGAVLLVAAGSGLLLAKSITDPLSQLGRTGLSRMEETVRNLMEAAASINAKLAVLNEKAGNINQVVTTTITRVADQTNPLAQCRHRSRKSRRIRARVCCSGHGDPEAGRPNCRCHLRHRGDGEGNALGSVCRGNGHGQVFRGSPAGRPRSAASQRAVDANHPGRAGADAAV